MKTQKENLRKNIKRDKKLTTFQKRVYLAVISIPKGEIRSYKWVARRIGALRAYRAAGTALKKNTRIGIIPCHRVVRSDGSLGGFSKGLKVKKRLLRIEGLDLK